MARQDDNQFNWNLGGSGRQYSNGADSNGAESNDAGLDGSDSGPLFVETEIRRKRGRGWIGLSVFLVILIAIIVALDNGARWYVGNLIKTTARSSLSLAASTPVTVKIGGTSVLYQAATGRFERVDVTIDSLGLGDLSGKATLTAIGVPLTRSKPIESARVVFAASADELKKLLAGFTGPAISSVKIVSGAVQLGTAISALGVSVPVLVDFVPSAIDGQLALTPVSLVVNGAPMTPAALRATFGAIAEPLLATQKVCVAKYLPKQLPLDSVTMAGSSLQLAVSGRSVLLSTALLTSKGVCP
ncbi:DUF2993 domain-containing protein [Frigoribacterium sp. CG_9.8]|uniref:LmeA family phospholipid-binding protein n=1 Tax=Frigoribacterium sp. CG_9.8 TaxID=2787733 RepID=UPI0018C9681C|nr:hypothetical protein [Frigoribacterium sp. CG_9.8]